MGVRGFCVPGLLPPHFLRQSNRAPGKTGSPVSDCSTAPASKMTQAPRATRPGPCLGLIDSISVNATLDRPLALREGTAHGNFSAGQHPCSPQSNHHRVAWYSGFNHNALGALHSQSPRHVSPKDAESAENHMVSDPEIMAEVSVKFSFSIGCCPRKRSSCITVHIISFSCTSLLAQGYSLVQDSDRKIIRKKRTAAGSVRLTTVTFTVFPALPLVSSAHHLPRRRYFPLLDVSEDGTAASVQSAAGSPRPALRWSAATAPSTPSACSPPAPTGCTGSARTASCAA